MKYAFRFLLAVLALSVLMPSWCRAGDASSPDETAVLGGVTPPAAEGEAPPAEKPKKKSKKKAKKSFDYDSSKYKAKVEAEPSTYRFNAKGEPVIPDSGKKKSKKKKSSSEDSEDGVKSSVPSDEKTSSPSDPACEDEAGCSKPE